MKMNRSFFPVIVLTWTVVLVQTQISIVSNRDKSSVNQSRTVPSYTGCYDPKTASQQQLSPRVRKISEKFYAERLITNCQQYVDNTTADYPSYDGWYNHPTQPELGAVDTPLLRFWPADYEDDAYKPRLRHRDGRERPNPLEISSELFKGYIGSRSRRGSNVLMVFFGQHVFEEIVDVRRPACPPEYMNIQVPEDHPYRTVHSEMPVLRTRYDVRSGQSTNNPRQQLNEVTPYLDGGAIYGTSKAWSDYLRRDENGVLVEDGLLASSFNGTYPANNTVGLPMTNSPPPARHADYVKEHQAESVTRFFKLGSPRVNENPFLLSVGVVWFRWHNELARTLKRLNPHWSGEKIFNEARKWVIASQQKVVFYEWLPEWLGAPVSKYSGYNDTTNPQIEQMFETAAFRYGHTLMPAGVYLRDPGEKGCKLNPPAIRTCNTYWLPENRIWKDRDRVSEKINVEKILMGMSVQIAEEEDHFVVDDLRESLYGPLEFSRRDAVALTIQHGRDHGVPDYNTARKIYGLSPITNFSHFLEFSKDREIHEKLPQLYDENYDDIDLWVGGMLETKDGPGELFTYIILDQFERIRKGDRYWFENKQNGLFTEDQIERLKQLNFRTIIRTVVDPNELSNLDIPPNIFRVPESKDDIHLECVGVRPQMRYIHEGTCHLWNQTPVPCWHVRPVDNSQTEACTPLQSYDYFQNSGSAFVLTFCFIAVFFLTLVIILWIKLKKVERASKVKINPRLSNLPSAEDATSTFGAHEWVGFSKSTRPVILCLNRSKRQIQVKNHQGYLTRALDFRVSRSLIIFAPHESPYLMIRVHHNYDLVLKFDTVFLRRPFIMCLEMYLMDIDVHRETVAKITSFAVLKQAVTMEERQKKLAHFFRVVFAQAFNLARNEDEDLKIDAMIAKEVIGTELTILEFAEALSMRPDSEFVRKIFNVIDTDKNGFISFREFIDMLVLFLKGTAEDKVKLMFDMYDINGVGHLKREDFAAMLRSFMETVNADISDNELVSLTQSMMERAHIVGKESIDLEDFKKILCEYNNKLSYMELEFNISSNGASRTLHAGKQTIRSKFIGEVKKTVESLYADPNDLRMRVQGSHIYEEIDQFRHIVNQDQGPEHPITKFIANNQLEIFWGVIYTAVLWALFYMRYYHFSTLMEHTGLRRIMGAGISVTQGSAYAMMFAYSTLLLTKCHNTITLLRDTFLQFYIPFDVVLAMHMYVAYWALLFTLLHVIGYAFNFYHMSTQTADDLACLFRNHFYSTHELPKFQYWMWGTMAGVTGILLTLTTGIIFIFSIPVVRRKIFKWFEYTHCLYSVFYILILLHGSGRLIQEPHFVYFFLGPAILFTIDRLFTATRKTMAIPLLKADFLPSDVMCLIFHKPKRFQYKAGQWVRISCPDLNTSEYHPFTLSSAPHEPILSVHIRSVGPWTTNIRNKLDPTRMDFAGLPKIHIDGPYGESHQNWAKYDVCVMIGSGIGVTPFASILKDIVHKTNLHHDLGIQKVYFIWITRSQKQFEWMVDIIREVEAADVNKIVTVHIFITQFYQKFDLRTILLYICERHFQKVHSKSLFTGLKAVTHFGRPNFSEFFMAIQRVHKNNEIVGVFSCGAPAVTSAVDSACRSINSRAGTLALFQHHYKNF